LLEVGSGTAQHGFAAFRGSAETRFGEMGRSTVVGTARKVLLVDSDFSTRMQAIRALMGAGYEVSIA
jgi:PleD family two-component response regulator